MTAGKLSSEEQRRLSEVEQFLFEEAALLDEGRYEEWLDLLTDDIRYRVPATEFVDGADRRLDDIGAHHFDESKDSLRNRVGWLTSGFNNSERPASLKRRIIGNVRILKTDASGALTVASNFFCWLGRWDGQSALFVGAREDVVVPRPEGGWRIASRLVRLSNPVLPRAPTTFF